MERRLVDGPFLVKSLISLVVIIVGITIGLFLGNYFGLTGDVVANPMKPSEMVQDTNMELGQEFPEVSIVNSNGEQASLVSLLGGKKSLVCFVTNGCDACLQFLDVISEKSILPDDSYQVILVSPNLHDLSYFKENYSYQAYQVSWDFCESKNIDKFPTIIGVDQTGAIKFIHTGYFTQLDSEYIKKYL